MKRHAGEARDMMNTKFGQAKQGFKDHVASWKDLQNLQKPMRCPSGMYWSPP